MSHFNWEQVGISLTDFISEFGDPYHLTFDRAWVQAGRNTTFTTALRRYESKWNVLQPFRSNKNPSEASFQDIKKKVYCQTAKKRILGILWNFVVAYVYDTQNVTASGSRYAWGRNPLDIITVKAPNIFDYLDFGIYDWVMFRRNTVFGPPELEIWLGVSHRVGPQLFYWTLTPTGQVVSCATIQRWRWSLLGWNPQRKNI